MRLIGHLDMDAFFAAIEERDNPRWGGWPIVVGSEPLNGRGRGVVSTANYKAREYGIRSANPISRAWQMSEAARKQGKPPAIFLPVNFRRYEEISSRILVILRRHVAVVEPASIDEAYFELSFVGSYASAEDICQKIKAEIKNEEKLTASIGVGPNKLIAKIASDAQKPDGLTVIKEDEMVGFLEPLPIRKIPGIGPKTEAMFRAKNIFLVRDLKNFSLNEMEDLLGKWGIDLYQKIRGVDTAPLQTEYEAKSIGEQETFLKDTNKTIFIFERLKILCENVFSRFKNNDFKSFKTVAITVRFGDFETKTRAHTLKQVVGSRKVLESEAIKLLLPFLDSRANPRRKMIRLIGVRIEKFQ